jgi:hypothetical protein
MKPTLLLILCVGIAIGSYFVYFGQRITLVATNQLDVFSDADGKNRIATLNAGDVVAVETCTDTKSIIYPVVILPNGTTGNIFDSNFLLQRSGIFNRSSIAPISFACP